HDRVGFDAIYRQRCNTRATQHVADIEVVQLKGEAERDDAEVPERTLRLDRQRLPQRFESALDAVALVASPVTAPGRRAANQHRLGKHALADEAARRIEQAVHALEAEIAHPDRVGIRVAQGDRQPAAPVLADGALLAREALALHLNVLRSNASQCLSV